MAASKKGDEDVRITDTRFAGVGAQLQAAAERLDLTYREVAARAGLTVPAVRKAFRGGNITLHTFQSLVEALGLTVVEFGRFRAAVEPPDMAATQAAFDDLTELERRVAETRASLGKTLEQQRKDHETMELIREIASDVTRDE